MPRLVQFMHYGRQPDHKGPGVKPWNTGEHRRSFLVAPGAFKSSLSGPAESAPRLAFWGEWEAPAEVLAAGGAAYTAFAPRPVVFPMQAGLQNTDPFVFDGPFLYSCCKQVWKNGTATFLRDLNRGDVVLFGSKLDGNFVLDTVFVVADSTPYGRSTGPDTLSGRVPQSFVEATLKPLAWPVRGTDSGEPPVTCSPSNLDGADACSSCHPLLPSDPEVDYRLYWGATPETHVNGMFSFVPAKQVSEPLIAFNRPVVKDFVSPGLSQNFRDCLDGAGQANSVKEAWAHIAELVLGAGLVLGTAFLIPNDAHSA